jgi:hypothetical protein
MAGFRGILRATGFGAASRDGNLKKPIRPSGAGPRDCRISVSGEKMIR